MSAIASAMLRAAFVSGLALAPGLTSACSPFVEVHASGTSATLRPDASAFERCTIDEPTYRRVVSEWLRSRPAGILALSLGRAVSYPWLSAHIADSALAAPGWAARISRARGGERDKLAAEVLGDPALLGRLAVAFEGTPYAVTRVSFEKILFGRADEHSSGRNTGPVLVPFDAQLWLRISSKERNAMALDILGLWDYSKPALSEQRFRDALATATHDEALVLQTQIARTWGLRKDFVRAREILASISDPVKKASAEAQANHLLELGRTYASPAHPKELLTAEARQQARSLYLQAFETARHAHLDYLAIDALHMMPMADPDPKAQLEWDLKALDYLEASSQPAAKKWEGSLRNNVGYAKHLLGQYDEALTQFKLSLAAHERAGKTKNVRIAYWMIAWTLRAQGKLHEAIDIQLRLEREWEQAGEPDPYVFEELEHLYRAAGDATRADAYAAKLAASKK